MTQTPIHPAEAAWLSGELLEAGLLRNGERIEARRDKRWRAVRGSPDLSDADREVVAAIAAIFFETPTVRAAYAWMVGALVSPVLLYAPPRLPTALWAASAVESLIFNMYFESARQSSRISDRSRRGSVG